MIQAVDESGSNPDTGKDFYDNIVQIYNKNFFDKKNCHIGTQYVILNPYKGRSGSFQS
jgi:hypothetical protein